MCNYIFTLHTSTNISFLSVDSSSPTIFNQLYLLALSRKSLNCADWELQDKPFNLNSDKKKKKKRHNDGESWNLWKEWTYVQLALTILTATVWLQVTVVCPLLDPDVQLPRQNADRGGLSTAGRSCQQQDAPLQITNPNLQFHSRLRGRFNDPGLRRKVVFVICYHHGITSPPQVSIKCCYQIIRPFSQHIQGLWSVPHFQASEAILTEFSTHNPISIRIKPPSNKLEIIQWKASLLTVHWQPCGVGAPRNLELILTELFPKAEGKKKQQHMSLKRRPIGLLVAIGEGTGGPGLGLISTSLGQKHQAAASPHTEEQQRWIGLLVRTPCWCLRSCFVQVQPGQDPKEDPHCSPWGPGVEERMIWI